MENHKNHVDHISEQKGHVSDFHRGVVHKPIAVEDVMKLSDDEKVGQVETPTGLGLQ